MAAYQIAKRKNGKYVKVYYWCEVKSKQVMLSREYYRHLDRCGEETIQSWVEEFERVRKGKVNPSRLFVDHPTINTFLEQYSAQLKAEGLDIATRKQYMYELKSYGVPFFTNDIVVAGETKVGLVRIEDWPLKSNHFKTWYLETTGNSENTCNRVMAVLQRFWDWLVFKDLILPTRNLTFKYKKREKRQGNNQLKTVLPRPVEPDEVLSFISETQSEVCKFIAATGYGASLRPQEIFALTPSDFVKPEDAVHLELNNRRATFKMYNRLSINIQNQLGAEGVKVAKTLGMVTFLTEDFAKITLPYLQKTPEGVRFYQYNRRWFYDNWKKFGIEGISIKDLRRASLHYLAHKTPYRQNHVDLMNFARHTNFPTTLIYIKTPWKAPKTLSDNDWSV